MSLKAQELKGRQCVLAMRTILRICGNESQPGLQLGEKLVACRLKSWLRPCQLSFSLQKSLNVAFNMFATRGVTL